jgi:hypothetical protein
LKSFSLAERIPEKATLHRIQWVVPHWAYVSENLKTQRDKKLIPRQREASPLGVPCGAQKHNEQKVKMTAQQRADRGMFLSIRELAEVTGFGENKLHQLKKQSGFPLFEGKTTLSKFQEWAFMRARPAAEILPDSHTSEHPPHSGGNKSCEPFR